MITQIKKQISECEKEIERIRKEDFPYYDKIRHKRIELSTLKSCLKLAEETKEKLREEISDWNMAGEFKGFIKITHVNQIIEKTFGGQNEI